MYVDRCWVNVYNACIGYTYIGEEDTHYKLPINVQSITKSFLGMYYMEAFKLAVL